MKTRINNQHNFVCDCRYPVYVYALGIYILFKLHWRYGSEKSLSLKMNMILLIFTYQTARNILYSQGRKAIG